MPTRIDEITKPVTAKSVLLELKDSGPYEHNILQAARRLYDNIAWGLDYKYRTQWASGSTLWEGPGGRTLIVTTDGEIRG